MTDIINDGETLARSLRTRIDKFGFTVLGVSGEDHSPSFVYSIGMASKHHFELFISGFPPEIAKDVFTELEQIPDVLSDGAIVTSESGLINGEPVRFLVRSLPLERCVKDTMFQVANFVEVASDMVAYVLIPGDTMNRLPGEEGYKKIIDAHYFEELFPRL